MRYAFGGVFLKETTLKKMWDAFALLPKEDVPETGDDIGVYIYRKFVDMYFADEMMSELEIIAWSPLNPNPVTNRKYIIFQGKSRKENICSIRNVKLTSED
jgi:hypothetical protein